MSHSKKDLEILMTLLSNFVSGMTNEEYEDLVNGYSEIKSVPKNLKKEDYLAVIYELNNQKPDEKKTYLENYMKSKKDLVILCKFLGIDNVSKDTIAALMNKIIEEAQKEESNIQYKIATKHSKQNEMLEIISFLEGSDNPEKAIEFLKERNLTKNEYLNLARKMNVFPEKNSNVESIINMIVKNVVDAKLRSLKIRNKI